MGIGVAAVLGALAARVAQRRGTTAAAGSGEAGGEERFACACGAEYRTTGAGRHRVFWVLDAPADDPVLEDHCPACGKAWPDAGHATPADAVGAPPAA
ncbi:MAG: hypothetical protein JWR63_1213 [Conexibacter sp.]|nr:hypothetical protein [Conexibacter sp.]